MKKYSAKAIFDGHQNVFTNKVIITDNSGKILAIEPIENHEDIQYIDGIICPGFVNTHCHLELSHMHGRVDTGTGLLPFLQKVVRFRDIGQEEIDEAIKRSDQNMYNSGIVAVGDISNKIDTAKTKSLSQIRYYTFVEMFDFLQPHLTKSTFDNYKKVFDEQSDHGYNKKSMVPHAPYTVSEGLFEMLKATNQSGATISIHNQETHAENELFTYGRGEFLDFYKGFGFDLSEFVPNGKSSIYYALKNMDSNQKTLFVHNTLTTQDDIRTAQNWSNQVYWATCPNANLYIENRLPNYSLFEAEEAKMTIGTDSLTSNWQLNIWEEVKTIKKYASYLSLQKLIQWATINGAEALGYNNILGSIEVGKTPGLVAIENIHFNIDDFNIQNSTSRLLI